MLLINQIVFFSFEEENHTLKQSWTFEIKINLHSVFSLSSYDVWILRLMMHLTHLFSLFTYWKNVTLCLSSLLIMMNWSSSHSLTSHSPSSFSYSPDAMSDNVPILSSFNSYHPASSIVLYIYDAHVYLLLRSTFQNLSLSWTYRKRKKTKKREFFLLFLFRWIFHPLQSKNENHHHQHVIITYSYTFSSSIYTYIICSKKKRRKKKRKWGPDLTSQLKSNIMYKTRCCLTHQMMI